MTVDQPSAIQTGLLLRNLYGFQPLALTSLARFDNPGRGVYRVEDAQGDAWLLRLARQDGETPWPLRPARVLQWLATQGYPAPRVRATLRGDLVGAHGGWWASLLTFVQGPEVQPEPAVLRAVGAALARLHALSEAPDAGALAASPWHPVEAVPETLHALAAAQAVPASLQPLWQDLAACARNVEAQPDLPRGLVHGDCWHTNAIQADGGGVVFVDWDNAGWGLPLLDLGQLLLASHYDLARPLHLEPDPARIAAVLAGYSAERPLSRLERETLLSAMRFGLARRFASVLVKAARGEQQADDAEVRKLAQRSRAAGAVAALAEAWLARG